MAKLTIAEANTLKGALSFLRMVKEQNDGHSFAAGMVRGLITSIGCFTGFGNIYIRLANLEDQIRRPVKRCLP